jgi:hypothetical protein
VPGKIFEEKIVEGVAKIASGMLKASEFSIPILAGHVIESIRIVGERLRPSGDLLYCVLCGRGPFTRKGYYLHLIRIHYYEILELVRDEIERVGRVSKL